MIGGHYATALVPYARMERKAPLWLLLSAAMLVDFLLIALVAGGVETMVPDGETPPDMRYSHDLLPVLGLAAAASLAIWAVTRRQVLAVWVGALILLHELADVFSGYQHNVNGPDSHAFGLNNYMTNPAQALGIEALLIIGCLAYYHWHEGRAGRPFEIWKSVVLFFVLMAPTTLAFGPQIAGLPAS
ncbi:MAG: hypothetical protein HEP70_12775 [Rhodobiaceae bacterium]|nr:hypothetical protein [Rhodobiaceae bacterium]